MNELPASLRHLGIQYLYESYVALMPSLLVSLDIFQAIGSIAISDLLLLHSLKITYLSPYNDLIQFSNLPALR